MRMILPGFMMSSGSIARLIARITSSADPISFREIHLALPDAVLAGAGSVHGDGALGKPRNHLLGGPHLVRVIGIDEHTHMKIAVADMADDRRNELQPVEIGLGFHHAIGKPRDRHAGVGRKELDARPKAARPRNRRRGAPATTSAGPPRASRSGSRGRRTPLRSRRTPRPVPSRLPGCRGTPGRASGSPAGRALNRGCRRAPVARRGARSARPGCRYWIVAITCLQADSTSGNAQTAAEIACGIPCSLSVSSVMTPSVPSEPIRSRVRS